MISRQEIADMIIEKDRKKREAAVDTLTENEAKQALKEILHTMNRWTDGLKEHEGK